MDSKITLSYGSKSASTIVSNNFIDKYMTDARGSDVKVYIYLLRCVQNPSFPVSIESIAEALGETEKEIRIALKYWDEQHVLSVSTTRNGKIKDITLHDLDEDDDNEVDFGSNVTILSDARRNRKSVPEPAPAMLDGRPYGRRATDIAIPVPAPENEPEQDNTTPIVKPNYSSQMIQSFKTEYPEFDELIDYIENLLGTTLSQRSLQTPAFIFEELGFPAELIKFLYDYCVGKGKRTNSYIEKVAREWHSKGILTVDAAKYEIEEFNGRYSVVKTSFGINRNFGEAELLYLRRWYDEYGFTDEVVQDACNRTLLATSRPSFEYADKILSEWHRQGVRTTEDIQNVSSEFRAANRTGSPQRAVRNTNQALQYSQRTYTEAEISAIEKKKLGIL
ncbi:MAG: DnaD domain protein [Lachnospiraceae bacterium]|nr:DnaD domain protein [Lachnospiraceae bacterium]